MSDELRNLLTKKDNELYPNSDNRTLSLITVHAFIATLVELEKSTDEIKKYLQERIDELK